MRRFLFNFSVSLFAFGVGLSFVYFKFPDAKENSFVLPIEITATAQTIDSKPAEKTEPKNQEVKFVCRNDAFLFVLNLLRKDKEDGEYTNDFIEGAQIQNCDELFEVKSRIDLNNDGNKELIIRSKNSSKYSFFCGATGNCSTWLLGKNGKDYKLLLDAGTVEEVKPLKGKRRGFQNLSSRYHGGTMNHTIGIYKFTGKKYNLTACSDENGLIDGSVVFVKKPLTDCQ
jgi:hypothetical protein